MDLNEITALQATRTELSKRIAEINETIRQRFAAAEHELAALKASVGLEDNGPKQGRPKGLVLSAETRARMSAAAKARFARARMNGAEALPAVQ